MSKKKHKNFHVPNWNGHISPKSDTDTDVLIDEDLKKLKHASPIEIISPEEEDFKSDIIIQIMFYVSFTLGLFFLITLLMKLGGFI